MDNVLGLVEATVKSDTEEVWKYLSICDDAVLQVPMTLSADAGCISPHLTAVRLLS